jgi:hypothetical protein
MVTPTSAYVLAVFQLFSLFLPSITPFARAEKLPHNTAKAFSWAEAPETSLRILRLPGVIPACGRPDGANRLHAGGLQPTPQNTSAAVPSMALRNGTRQGRSRTLPRLVRLTASMDDWVAGGMRVQTRLNRSNAWESDEYATDFSASGTIFSDDNAFENLEEKYETLQYLYDCVPSKLCRHRCANRTLWVLTCCRCNGVLPEHGQERVASQGEDEANVSLLAPELARFLEPHGLLPGQRIYDFTAEHDESAGALPVMWMESSSEDEPSTKNECGSLEMTSGPATRVRVECERLQDTQGVGTVQSGIRGGERRPRQELCWVCALADDWPLEHLALSSDVALHWPHEDDTREIRTRDPWEPLEETVSDRGGWWGWGEANDGRILGLASGLGLGDRDVSGVWEGVWEKVMALGAELIGPWWVLRVIESHRSRQSVASMPMASQGTARDATWNQVCLREVGSRPCMWMENKRVLPRPRGR